MIGLKDNEKTITIIIIFFIEFLSVFSICTQYTMWCFVWINVIMINLITWLSTSNNNDKNMNIDKKPEVVKRWSKKNIIGMACNERMMKIMTVARKKNTLEEQWSFSFVFCSIKSKASPLCVEKHEPQNYLIIECKIKYKCLAIQYYIMSYWNYYFLFQFHCGFCINDEKKSEIGT